MDAATLNRHLETHLRVHTFPIGIKSLKPGEPLPEKVKIPTKHLGVKVAICQAISITRRYGWTMAFSGAGLSPPTPSVSTYDVCMDFGLMPDPW